MKTSIWRPALKPLYAGVGWGWGSAFILVRGFACRVKYKNKNKKGIIVLVSMVMSKVRLIRVPNRDG